MKRIGITTITILVDNENAYNYGNKLQNYALQEFLRKNGFNPETIKYKFTTPKYNLKEEENKNNKKDLIQIIDDGCRIIKRKIFRRIIAEKRLQRIEKFKNFVEANIRYNSEIYEENSKFDKLNEQYDYFITGSDQVWNPYCEGSNEFYYLTFAPKDKRIAYAPSIAVNAIPEEAKKDYKKWIGEIKNVSIREDVGKEILKKEFDIDAKLVCDPVFLLNREMWQKIEKNIETPEKYFLIYILGKKNVETKKAIKKLEKKYNMKGIDLYTRDDKNSSFSGPEEFIGLLDNAEFVFTDSFHGTAFASIFEKPMIIVDRKTTTTSTKMNSRIESLLRLLEIENRSVEYILNNPNELNIDYTLKSIKLKKLIEESKDYLLSALDNK